MQAACEQTLTVDAKVEQVRSTLGLAVVVSESGGSWGVHRATPGIEFDQLQPGQRLRLQLQNHRSFTVVRECRLLE